MDNSDRRKEILNVCLDTFINKGLSETTVRDLSTALKLQSGGIYYWFKDKDEAVVACAEEAALRLENFLIFPALKDIKDPDKMMKRLKIRADEMQPTMKFFASVCALSKYEERMQPVLDRLAERYEAYARRFSKELNCDFDAVAPYVYFAITTKILQFPALTLCNSANGGKALIFRRFRHLPFGRVIRISRRIPA